MNGQLKMQSSKAPLASLVTPVKATGASGIAVAAGAGGAAAAGADKGRGGSRGRGRGHR